MHAVVSFFQLDVGIGHLVNQGGSRRRRSLFDGRAIVWESLVASAQQRSFSTSSCGPKFHVKLPMLNPEGCKEAKVQGTSMHLFMRIVEEESNRRTWRRRPSKIECAP